MRAYLRSLERSGLVERYKRREFAAITTCGLTEGGHDLLEVAESLDNWLRRSPHDPIELGTIEGKHAVKALTEGWSAGIVRALAARPLSLTELDRIIDDLSYPSLERRLSAMRLHGQLESVPGAGRSTPFTPSCWLSAAIVPLAAAAKWERRHEPGWAPPITNRDVEATFLLTAGSLRLAEDLSGSCRLTVRTESGEVNRVVGVIIEVVDGDVVSCVTRLQGSSDARVVGSASSWFSAMEERDASGLEMGGEPRLAAAILDGMQEGLRRSTRPLIDKPG